MSNAAFYVKDPHLTTIRYRTFNNICILEMAAVPNAIEYPLFALKSTKFPQNV